MHDDHAKSEVAVAELVTCVERALAVPRGHHQSDTVVDALGAPVVDAGTFRKYSFEPATWVDRRAVLPDRVLPGAYLFAGEIWSHFGHFLFESLARLWAHEGLRGQIDGIVFFRTRDWQQPNEYQTRLMQLLGVDAPIVYVDSPTEFGRLYVPRQGCGIGPLSAGTPAFRAFVRDRLGRVPARQDAPRIYLTRSGYGLRRGGILTEAHLEALLQQEGYVSFAPERHSIEEQIATYRGAEKIIGPDSSALHLVGYVCDARTQVGIVLRRLDGAKDILPQLAGFTGRMPEVIDAIRTIYRRENERNPTWALVADLDMGKVWRQLHAAGMIGSEVPWADMHWRRRQRLAAHLQETLGGRLLPVWPETPTSEAQPAEAASNAPPRRRRRGAGNGLAQSPLAPEATTD